MATDKKCKKLNKFVAILLLTVTCLSLLAPATTAQAEVKEINGHKLICENANLRLYLDETDLSLVVEDKKSGSYMESSISYDDGKSNKTWLGAMKSALLLTMINKSTDTKQADLVNDKVTKKVTKTKDGFSAVVYWTKYKFGMTLNVTLNEDGITACVPDESIIEDGTDYQIGTIAIYPYMGTSYLDSKKGYMLIPDGNGALIYLNNKEGKYSSGYSSMIYGNDNGFDELTVDSLLWDKYEIVNDNEQVIAPVYGIAHTDDKMAFLAVVEKGAMRASIEAWPNGASVDYNRVYAKFIERKLYIQPTSNNSSAGSFKIVEADRSHSDLQIRYMFLNGENANYCGMANAYRDYLLGNGTLKAYDSAYRTRVDFLGTERKNWVIGTSKVTMTTVSDIKEIYADLRESGVNNLFTVYKGWQDGGLWELPVTSYDADRAIGGTAKLTELIKSCEADGTEFFLYNDALRINPETQNATFNIIKKINKRKFEEQTYKEVYEKFMYLTPNRTDYLLTKMAKSYVKKGVNNLCVGGITNTLFSWNYSTNYFTRYDCGEKYLNALETLNRTTDLVLEQPSAYLWGNTKAFTNMPLYTSSYIYEDEAVPFLSIVLKGYMPVYSEYVNFEANKQEFFLKLVETGTYPSFYITAESSSELIYTNSSDVYSSEYEAYKDTIKTYDKELKAINNKVAGAHIVGHEIGENRVTTVTYSNGVKIYVNYSNETQKVNGVTLGAMSYKVGD